MECPKCGTVKDQGRRYCSQCGYDFESSGPNAEREETKRSEARIKRCPRCNWVNDSKSAFCSNCGKCILDSNTYECPQCHQKVWKDDNFCPNCDYNLGKESKESAQDSEALAALILAIVPGMVGI